MSEKDRPDHWTQLASDLGAETPPEPPERESSADESPAAASRPAAEAPRPRRQPRPLAPPRPAADWDFIAEELGIVGRGEPVEEAEAVEEVIERIDERVDLFEEPGPPPAGPSEAEEQEVVGDALAEAADAFAAAAGMFDGGEETIALPGELPQDLLEARRESLEAERPARAGKPRRRKRRRKLKTSKEAAPSEAAEAVEAAEREIEDELPFESEEPASEAATRAAEENRSKRRRRRRKRPSDEQAEAREAAPKRGPAGERIEAHDQPDEEEQEAEEPAAGQSSKAAHRAIPTWGEAIGLIIGKNLESRAKRPGPYARGRNGGRGHGRDRGRGSR